MTRFRTCSFSLIALLVFTAFPLTSEAQDRQQTRERDRWQDGSARSESSASSDRRRADTARRRPTPQQYIDRFDEDGNGAIDRQEASRWLSQRFDRLDRNADDQITSNELERGRRGARSRIARQRRSTPVEVVYIWVADLDRGELNLDDIQSAYETLRDVDADGDGQITRSELNERRQEMLGRWAQTMINRCDTNDDNRISRQEASGTVIEQRFARIDRNGDDQLSSQELRRSLSSQFRQSSPQDDYESSDQSQAYRSEDLDR